MSADEFGTEPVATYDLTHPLDAGTPTYPGDPPVELDPHATVEADGYRVTDLRLGSHAGTHVDAPSHTEPNGASLAAFDPADFVFDARLVDCGPCDSREAIGPEAVPESTDAELLLFRTGWAAHWGEARYWDHPYLGPAAAERCADLGVAVGLDAASPDPTPVGHGELSVEDVDTADEPDGVPAHRALLGRGLLVVENLTGLDRVPERFELRAYPLGIDADGSPVRAVAVTAE
ncbi:cyclase family protein [Halobium salinum]|uniref:Cyclase family protein n=1 Tax=Halobium salinum TaxID=1364940 RepID=A0ABD5P8I8_9EURY|nr:cyclase family protein [Halobium salinum]